MALDPACATASSPDEDVHDTWFTSRCAVLDARLPDDTRDFERYYPTNELVTGFDNIFLWGPG